MALPIQSLRLSRLHALRALTPFERRAEAHKDLSFWTNLGLAVAVLIGIAVIFAHGGNRTSAIAAFGGALGVGAVLGFLFGVQP